MFKVDSAGIRKQLKWSRRTHTLANTRIHAHTLARAHSHAHSRTHISSSIANLTASWYFIKIKYSEPNISAASSVSPLAFAVLLLVVIKQRCIAAGAPFWIGGELPVFVVRHHAPNRDACTVTFGTNTCTVPRARKIASPTSRGYCFFQSGYQNVSPPCPTGYLKYSAPTQCSL